MIDNKAVDIALLKDQIEVMRSRLIAMTQDRDDCLKLAKMNFTKSEETESLRQQLASRDAEVAELHNELETERMRNVACGVVAMADTHDSARQARDMHTDYMSTSCSDVARRVDECIKLREQVTMLRNEVIRCRDWFETQAKVTSKGGPSSWELMLLRDERDAADEALAATEPTSIQTDT